MASAALTICGNNAVPFIFGVAMGAGVMSFAGRKIEQTSSILHIIDLFHYRMDVKKVSLKEFRKEITFAQLNALRKNTNWAERTEKVWDTILEKSTFFVCVRQSGHLIGSGSFVGNGRRGTFFDIHVHTDYQGKQVGTIIMNHFIKLIQQENYFLVGLFASEEDKKAFYARFNFKPNSFGMEAEAKELQQVRSKL